MAKHELLVMDHTGHSQHAFDPADVVATEEIERRFKELVGKNFTAAVRTGPGELQQIRAFDPTAPEILLIPQRVGG